MSALTAILVGLVLVPVGAAASTPWSVVASPNAGTGDNTLYGVSCASMTSCTAVGRFASAAKIDRTLIETWNGTTWTRVAAPNVGTGHNDLFSVSCVPGTTFCAAVGGFWTSGLPHPLALVRHGTTWVHVVSPSVGVWSGFNAVSCVSASRCTGVGLYSDPAGVLHTLVEVWNGASWTRVASPSVGTTENQLTAVSCISAVRCTAVGYFDTAAKVDRTLVEVWNGGAWTRVASPNFGTSHNDLYGVSCVATSRCLAVGVMRTAAKTWVTLAMVWNGATWARVASVNVGTTDSALYGISCYSPTDCTAVGQYQNVANIHRSLVESWDGAHWTQVPAPNVGTGNNELDGVSCVTGTTICKAVGFYADPAKVYRTLTGSSS